MNTILDLNSKVEVKQVNGKKQLDAKSKEKLKNAAYEFQSLLVNQMLKSMRQTEMKQEDGEDSFGNDTFTELFDMQLSQHISKNSKLGIAEMLYKTVSGEDLKTPVTIQPNLRNEIKNNKKQNATEQIVNKVIASKDAVYSNVSKFDEIVQKASNKYKVEPNIIKAVIATESHGNTKAVSKANAKGLMQLIDGTADDMGVKDVFNPDQNIEGGSKYLSQLLKKFDGNLDHALAAYNAGPGAVERFNGIPPYDETKNYVKTVKDYLKMFRQKEQELALR